MLNSTQLKAVVSLFKKSSLLTVSTHQSQADGQLHLQVANSSYSLVCNYSVNDHWIVEPLLQVKQTPDHQSLVDLMAFDYNSEVQDSVIDNKTLQFVCRAMPKKDVRYYLNGLAVYPNGGIAATDGHRLHFDDKCGSYLLNTEREDPFIIPAEIINLVLKLDKKSAPCFRFGLPVDSGNINKLAAIECCEGHILITANLCDGKYPDIKRVIPKIKESLVSYTAPSQKELNLLVSIAKQQDREQKIKVLPGGRAERLANDWEPLPNTCGVMIPVQETTGFNAVYIRDSLIAGKDCNVGYQSPTDPLLVQHDDCSAVVMPLRA